MFIFGFKRNNKAAHVIKEQYSQDIQPIIIAA